jgi:hypothetical protein
MVFALAREADASKRSTHADLTRHHQKPNFTLRSRFAFRPQSARRSFTHRNKIAAMGMINFTERSGLMLRFFRGRTIFDGIPPESSLFSPNEIKEANLKVDIPNLSKSADIISGEAGLSLPFYLPIPESTVVLSRQIQWRIYADWGKAYDFDIEYKSKGVGVVLPLGGDISGVGSLAVTRFTNLLAKAYACDWPMGPVEGCRKTP